MNVASRDAQVGSYRNVLHLETYLAGAPETATRVWYQETGAALLQVAYRNA